MSNKKPDINLTFTSDKSDFTIKIYPPLNLEIDKWSIGLVCLDTYYSFSNINSGNNKLKYSDDNGTTWTEIAIPVGCYEIVQINEAIKEALGDKSSYFELAPNYVTLGSIITITNDSFKIDFDTNNSMAPVLGFNKDSVLGSGVNNSAHIVNILEVNSILVNCDIISNSYLNGSHSPVIYSFFPNVRPGGKIIQEPNTITFLSINRSYIESIRIWLTDQDGKTIDFRGEKITARLLLRHLS
jgi:hypothetical protein